VVQFDTKYIRYDFLLVFYSNFVPGIFDFEKCRDLEIRVIVAQGHWN